MTHPSRRAALGALAAVCILQVGCATLDSGTGSTRYGVRPAGDTPYERLDWAEGALRRTPNEPGLYLIRAEESLRLARGTEEPSERQPWYAEMALALKEFDLIAESRREPWHDQRDSLRTAAWQTEIEPVVTAIAAGGFPEALDEPRSQRLLANLRNARIVAPDSLSAYGWEAQLLYMQGDLFGATAILEEGIGRTATAPFDTMEMLAYLYMESGNLDGAITVYADLVDRLAAEGSRTELPRREEWVRRKRVRSAYANVLMLAGRHDPAIDVLRELHRDFPQDMVIRHALASELLYAVEDGAAALGGILTGGTASPDGEPVIAAVSALASETRALLAVLESGDALLRLLQAEPVLQEAPMVRDMQDRELDSRVLGMAQRFDQLSAGLLSAIEALDSEPAATFSPAAMAVREIRFNLLQLSLPLWEDLLDANPGEADIRRTLASVYEGLGMDEQAEDLREAARAGASQGY